MAIRADNALQFDGVKGVGIDGTTGALAPVVDAGTTLGSGGLSAVAKRYSDIVSELLTIQSDGGVKLTLNVIEEEITLATDAATTDSAANLLPANSLLLHVFAEVLTTVATATNWAVGDATTAARFIAATTDLTAGTTKVGLLHQAATAVTAVVGYLQVAAAKLRITTTGSQTTAGKIRVTVFYVTVAKAA